MTDEVASEEWAQRLRALGGREQARLLEGVAMLLEHPEAVSDLLETEVHILAEQLRQNMAARG